MMENDGRSHRQSDAPRVTLDILQRSIQLLRQRLKDEDDVNARLGLWALVRELELGQAILAAAQRDAIDDHKV